MYTYCIHMAQPCSLSHPRLHMSFSRGCWHNNLISELKLEQKNTAHQPLQSSSCFVKLRETKGAPRHGIWQACQMLYLVFAAQIFSLYDDWEAALHSWLDRLLVFGYYKISTSFLALLLFRFLPSIWFCLRVDLSSLQQAIRRHKKSIQAVTTLLQTLAQQVS